MSLGIRTRVILLALIAAAPLVASDLYQAEQAEQAALSSARREALLFARRLATMQGDIFDGTRNILAGFGAATVQNANSLGQGVGCDLGLRRLLAANPLHVNITVANERGDLICAAVPLAQEINVSDRDYFRRAVEQQGFALSGLVISRDSGASVLVAARPILNAQDHVAAVVLATFKLEDLGRTFARANLPGYLTTFIVDRNRKVLARWPYRPGSIGRTLSGLQIVGPMIGGDEGIADAVGRDGVSRVAAYVRVRDVSGDSLYVIASIPRETLLEGPRRALHSQLTWLAIALGLALTLGLLGSHFFVVRPIRKLTVAADLFRSGDLSARSHTPHGRDEVGKLASAFDALAESNQRVTRALRALSAGSRTLLRERGETQLLHEMCKIAVERGGYAVAYVCYAREDEAKSIDVVAQYGDDRGSITAVPLTWANMAGGQGTIGRCIRSGERSFIRSIAEDPNTGPWKEVAKGSGFAAVISLPLRINTTLIGTFTLVAREDGFDDAEIDLLDELAADLAFGIEVIRAETRRKEAEAIARRALTHDPVVDVPNRAWFVRRVIECIDRGVRNHEPAAILDLHLGRLQEILDSFGYEHGNEVLRQIADRLKRLYGSDESLARLPVDDFGIALCAYNAEAAVRAARSALDVFKEPIRLGEALIDVQAAVGITMFPDHGTDAETLIRRASIAARDAFRRDLSLNVYSGAMAQEDPTRLSLAAELRGAIETRQFDLHFQPKLSLADGSVSGCEALVRWQHPTRGMVPPLEFIGLAEEIGLIRPLTYKVMEMAIRQTYTWQAAGFRSPIAVNLSARNLHDPELLDVIDSMFSTWKVTRSLVHFEITEGALMDDPQAARKTLERLSEHGGKIYIDDFGTGYSSLSYLVSLPVHALKIDRSFIKQMSKSSDAVKLVASIISMAHNLNLRVVAEGVETAEDVAKLRGLGCDEVQGYFYSKPVTAAQYEGWLASSRAGAAISIA